MRDLARIRELAAFFRTAIELCDRKRLPITFKEFPLGSCGDAAILLGTFLKEEGAGTFTYMVGQRGEGNDRHSHAWLEDDGVIVDITADQFLDMTERVIVTTHSCWHKTFDQEKMHEADYRIFDKHTVATLGNAYKTILGGVVR